MKWLIIILFVVSTLMGCNSPENEEVSYYQKDVLLEENLLMVVFTVSSNEIEDMLTVKISNNLIEGIFNLDELDASISLRDMDSSVHQWPLTFVKIDEGLIANLSIPNLKVNSVGLNFYTLDTGLPFAYCVSISDSIISSFSCELKTVVAIKDKGLSINYPNLIVPESDNISLEGAVVSSQCQGPLGILGVGSGESPSSFTTFLPHSHYDVISIGKGDYKIFFMSTWYEDYYPSYSTNLISERSLKSMQPNNGYTEQNLKLTRPDQTIQTIFTPEFQSSDQLAQILDSYEGISASSQTHMTLTGTGFNYVSGDFKIFINGHPMLSNTLETLADEIEESSTLQLNAHIDELGDLNVLDKDGGDITLAICSSDVLNSIAVYGLRDAGPVVLGGTAISDRVVTIGGTVSWFENEGYELEIPIVSFLSLENGNPNTSFSITQ